MTLSDGTLAQASRNFVDAVGRFRAWALTVPEDTRYGEWECDYSHWAEIYSSWRKLLAAGEIEHWEPELIDTALFAIARDNECQLLANEVPRKSLGFLAVHAIARSEPDARWQLAVELGEIPTAETEALLLRLVKDGDEYVRRRALQSLARINSGAVTELALQEWTRAPDDMPWSRMNALWALHRVASPALELRVKEALSSSNELLREYAGRLSRGEIES
jgi:hypothetical protein